MRGLGNRSVREFGSASTTSVATPDKGPGAGVERSRRSARPFRDISLRDRRNTFAKREAERVRERERQREREREREAKRGRKRKKRGREREREG